MNKDLPNPINVIIYSYKNKNLKNVVANLVEKSSKKNNIFVKNNTMDTIDKIKLLAKEFPNDMNLGREVRKLLSEMKAIQKEIIIDMSKLHGDTDEDN